MPKLHQTPGDAPKAWNSSLSIVKKSLLALLVFPVMIALAACNDTANEDTPMQGNNTDGITTPNDNNQNNSGINENGSYNGTNGNGVMDGTNNNDGTINEGTVNDPNTIGDDIENGVDDTENTIEDALDNNNNNGNGKGNGNGTMNNNQ